MFSYRIEISSPFFSKQNVNQMVEYLESAIQAHKVHLLTTLNDDGATQTWRIPFDTLLQEVTISIAGPGRKLQVNFIYI